MFALTRTTMIVAAMTASVFATPAAFGTFEEPPIEPVPPLVNIEGITQNAAIDDADINTQVNSATITQNAENEAEIEADKKSKVKDNVLTAASVQTATVTQSNVNSDNDVNVIDQDLIELLINLGLLE